MLQAHSTEVASSRFPTWKRVAVGTLGTPAVARVLLTTAGIKLTECGDKVLEIMPFETAQTHLDLVRVTAKKLGLRGEVGIAQIFYAAAEQGGLSLCPPEVAVQLWLQHSPLLLRGEWAFVAMNPISDVYDRRWLFFLANTARGERHVNAIRHTAQHTRSAKHSWIFVRSAPPS